MIPENKNLFKFSTILGWKTSNFQDKKIFLWVILTMKLQTQEDKAN